MKLSIVLLVFTLTLCSTRDQLSVLSQVGSELDSLINEMKQDNPFEKHGPPQNGLSDNISSAFDAISSELNELDSMIENKEMPFDSPETGIYFRNPSSETDFMKSISDLSEDVERNVSIAKKHSIHREKLNSQGTKIQLLDQLKGKYKEIAGVLQNVSSKAQHRASVISLLKEVTGIYKQYVSVSHLLGDKMKLNLTQLENQIEEAKSKDVEITNLLNQFYSFDTLFKRSVPSQDKEMSEINSYLSKIAELDQTNLDIKKRILLHLEYLRNNHTELKYNTRLQLQTKYLNMVHKLIAMNDEVTKTKETIIDILKKNSALKLDSLQQMTDNSKYNSLFETSKRLIGNQENINKIRNKISENISRTSDALGHKGALGEFKNKVSEVFEKIKDIKERRAETHERIELAKKLIENNRQMSNVYAQIELYKEELRKQKDHDIPKHNLANLEIISAKLKELIEHSKEALKLIENNKRNRLTASAQYNKMIDNLKKMKETVVENSKSANLAPEQLQQLVKSSHLQIKKLTHLYKYIKEGNVHNYLHNQVLRKLVNLNSSVLADIDLKKLQLSLKLTT